jgi:muramidase (phage lysozyme)
VALTDLGLRLQAWVANPNVRALLHVIRVCEGTADEAGYRRLVGGGAIASFADHPRTVIRGSFGNGLPYVSSAAGAYQFIADTWDEAVAALGLPDFSPESQDLAAVWLIWLCGALDDAIAGRVEAAVRRINRRWASLPGAPYGQPTASWTRVRKAFTAGGGNTHAGSSDIAPDLGGGAATGGDAPPESSSQPRQIGPLRGSDDGSAMLPNAPSPQRATDGSSEASPPPKNAQAKDSTMPAPIVAALLPALLPLLAQAIPEVARIIAGTPAGSARNIELGTKVLEVATRVTGAANAQEAVERIVTDPAVQAQAAQAIRQEWYELSEMGGGITAAREWNASFATSLDGRNRWWALPVVIITALLLPLVYWVVGAVMHGWGGAFTPETRSALVFHVTGLILGAVVGFFYGTSVGSARKTSDMLRRLETMDKGG